MPHLNDIEQKYIEKLIEFANQHPDYGTAEKIWHAINQADPDQQRHIHTRWLLERTLSDNPKRRLLWEDIAAGANSKAHDILKRFLTIRPLLSHDKRNLYRYGNLSDVTAVIRPLEHVRMPRELKAEERERVDNGTVVLYEQDGYKVLVPLSEEASCYWGRGTEWCTAATKSDNAFQSYHEDGPLVICILPDGKKYQFHQDSPPMDENDSELKNITDPILVQLCAIFGKIRHINKTFRDREVCLTVVRQHGLSLICVPDELRDREMCLEAVKQNGESLFYVPDKLRDREMCLVAVGSNGCALGFVPEKFLDREVYKSAVESNGWSLCYVPKKMRDRGLCLEAVKSNGLSLLHVPKELRDKEICLEAVKSNSLALEYVPMEYRDYELCLSAVKQNNDALIHVPNELRDKQICLEAVKQDGDALIHVPKELIDRDMFMKAVKDKHGFITNNIIAYCATEEVQKELEVLVSILEETKPHKSPSPVWIKTSILEDMTQYLQKSFSVSTLSPTI